MKKGDKVVYRWGGTGTILEVRDGGCEIWIKDNHDGHVFWTDYNNLKLYEEVKEKFEFSPYGEQ